MSKNQPYLFFLFSLFSFTTFTQQFEVEKQTVGSNTHLAKDFFTIDIDNDGFKDLLARSSQSQENITWYKNIDNTEFAEQKALSMGQFIVDVHPTDIDNDGDIDIVYSEYEPTIRKIYFLKNIGNGEFSAPVVLATYPTDEYKVFTMDIDLDGDQDIIVKPGANTFIELQVIENINNTSFSPPVPVSSQVNGDLEVLSVEDLNGDLFPDFITRSNNNISVWVNNGNMFFTESVITNTSGTPAYSADLNSDGLKDIIVGINILQGTFDWYSNSGNGQFQSEGSVVTPISFYYQSLEFNDIDNDGDQDIVYLPTTANSTQLSWVENLGGLNFASPQIMNNLGCQPGSFFKISDMNDDLIKDIVIYKSGSSSILIHHGDNNSSFNDDFLSISGQSSNVRKAIDTDLYGDGDNDLLFVNGAGTSVVTIKFFENELDGSFKGAKIIDNVYDFVDLMVYDLDLDNLNDIIVRTLNGFTLYRNNGNGQFSPPVPLLNASDVDFVSFGDLNNDSYLDIIYQISPLLGPEELYFRYNDGNGNFINQTSIPLLFSDYHSGEIFDIDNDNLPDFVGEKNGTFYWHKNTGTSFTSNSTYYSISPLYHHEFIDFDSDGDLDLVACSDSLFVMENSSTSVYGDTITLLDDYISEMKFHFADIEGDNDLDIFTFDENIGSIILHENVGSNNYQSSTIFDNTFIYASGYPICSNNIFATVDLDNDTDKELFYFGNQANGIYMIRNNTFSPNQVKGKIYVDLNQNGILDTNESVAPQVPVEILGTNRSTITNFNGEYFLDLSNLAYSTYTAEPNPSNSWGYTGPNLYNILFSSNYNPLDTLDFGLYPNSIQDSLNTFLTGGFPRCNDTINYWINLNNIGTSLPSGVIELKIPQYVDFYTSEIIPDSIVNDFVYWSFDSLNYFEEIQIRSKLILPDFNFIGDTLNYQLKIYSVNDLSSPIASDSIDQLLVCAYDPNDKNSDQSKFDPEGYITQNQEYLDYTIRFQNTGNDTAKVVRIVDYLDSSLIWNSITNLHSSHNLSMLSDGAGKVEFIFNDIYLPDSNVNFLGSQGYVSFRIDLQPNLLPSTKIYNQGRIYFDLNPAVLTNNRLNTIEPDTNAVSIQENQSNYIVYPNPFNEFITIKDIDSESNIDIELYDIFGRRVPIEKSTNSNSIKISIVDTPNGIYFLILNEEGRKHTPLKLLKMN